jgi:hypothetical protein
VLHPNLVIHTCTNSPLHPGDVRRKADVAMTTSVIRDTSSRLTDREQRSRWGRRFLPWGASLATIAAVAWLTIGGSTAVYAHTTTHRTPKSTYLVASGTGDKRLRSVTVAKHWTVGWTFNCPGATSAKSFALTAAHRGSKAATVTDQNGLGGGGNKPYVKAGTYRLDVETPCAWKVTVKPTA